ncbi:MAG TPA: type II secretion system F family protein [Tepidisphaeraceae bacterium]|nr:type II secretion system F family protein [Tepidisphaeraceae bacterium]
MGQPQVILLIALSASMAAWAIAQLIFSYFSTDKSKIQQRLSNNWRPDIAGSLNKPVTISLEMKEMPAFLARSAYMQRLYRKLVQAYPDAKLTAFLSLCGGVGLACFVLVFLIVDSFTGGMFAFLCGVYAPIVFLNGKRARRQKQLNNQLPEALDFLARILRAGHSLSTGLQMMGDELKPPVKEVFRRCYDQHSLGVPLETAMREMASRVDSGDFAFFVTAVLIQRQTGGDLTEVLDRISAMVRGRLRLQNHVKAITAEGRMTGNILVAFPAVLFIVSYILNPGYAGILIREELGKMLLGASVLFQIFGLVVIRRIVSVRI